MDTLNVALHPFWDFDITVPGVNIIRWDLEGETPAPLDIIVTGHWTPRNGIDIANKAGAHLLQIGSIGFDMLPEPPAGIQVANAKTVHETATAEMALTMLLAVFREIPRMVRGADEGRWDCFYSQGLAEQKVMLLGVGGVGDEIARRLEPFEVELTRVASREREDARGHVYSLAQGMELLGQQDAVIVVLPANEHTVGVIDDGFLSAMKDNAVLLNIGRGKLADPQALVKHSTRLRLALDVTDPEPLAVDDPLWKGAELITSHNGGNTRALHQRMKNLVERQIVHALAGEPFENIVLG
ncbi:NAD(P)-dependent oxidoreductase [Actinotignum urinale]|uniref:NAD(P)-dependent oxidoreductase n=1 Tax=Actinotignum urinale TaxID=190146 RepID=UPI00280B7B9B|nr:NAD(P)-dependent oxidoreductase [Actinotignum urinale]